MEMIVNITCIKNYSTVKIVLYYRHIILLYNYIMITTYILDWHNELTSYYPDQSRCTSRQAECHVTSCERAWRAG